MGWPKQMSATRVSRRGKPCKYCELCETDTLLMLSLVRHPFCFGVSDGFVLPSLDYFCVLDFRVAAQTN